MQARFRRPTRSRPACQPASRPINARRPNECRLASAPHTLGSAASGRLVVQSTGTQGLDSFFSRANQKTKNVQHKASRRAKGDHNCGLCTASYLPGSNTPSPRGLCGLVPRKSSTSTLQPKSLASQTMLWSKGPVPKWAYIWPCAGPSHLALRPSPSSHLPDHARICEKAQTRQAPR